MAKAPGTQFFHLVGQLFPLCILVVGLIFPLETGLAENVVVQRKPQKALIVGLQIERDHSDWIELVSKTGFFQTAQSEPPDCVSSQALQLETRRDCVLSGIPASYRQKMIAMLSQLRNSDKCNYFRLLQAFLSLFEASL